jgi:hypothetical protein
MAYFLAVVSALIAVMAGGTVFTLTRSLTASVLAGLIVIFDPMLQMFGLNGWSDSMTFAATAIVFLTFARAAVVPSMLRLVLFGGSLALLTFSHGTWVFPALAMAIVAWPLLVLRNKWLPSAVRESATVRTSTLRFAVPLASYVGVLALASAAIWTRFPKVGGAKSWEDLPIIGGSAYKPTLDRLANQLDPSIDAQVAGGGGVLISAGRYVIATFNQRLGLLLETHVANAYPFFAMILLVVGLAAIDIAWRTTRGGGPGRTGLIGVPLIAVLGFLVSWHVPASAAATLLVVAVLWLGLPFVRTVVALLAMPIAFTLLLVLELLHYRHTNFILYALIVTAGVALAESRLSEWHFPGGTFVGRYVPRARLLPGIAFAGLMAAGVFGVIQLAGAVSHQRTETAYLEWLGNALPASAVIATTGDVDPWSVHELTDRPVLYDIENEGRQLVRGGPPYEWTPRFHNLIPNPSTTAATMDYVRETIGDIWFYRPADRGDKSLLRPRLGTQPIVLEARRVAIYPSDLSRGSYRVLGPANGS